VTRSRIAAGAAALVLSATLLASCSSARSVLDTTNTSSSCYLALPTAAEAVGGQGHLEGVRRYTLNDLRGMAPRLYGQLSHDVPTKQAVCLAGYTGRFSASEVRKPLGRATGTVAVAVVTTPANKLLGTLILTNIPVRFRQTHPF